MGIYTFAKSFGVGIEKVYIWLDYKFSLLKFKINNTLYGFGWLPTGGYIKLTGLVHEAGEEMEPHHFKAKSVSKQIIILSSGAILSLIFSYTFYALSGQINSQGIIYNLVQLFVSLTIITILIAQVYKAVKSVTSFKPLIYLSIMASYLLYLIEIAVFIHQTTPFFADFLTLFKNDTSPFSEHGILNIFSFVGVLVFLLELIPLGGKNGFLIVNGLYQSITYQEVPDRIISKMTLFSLLVMIPLYGMLFYLLFF